MWLLLKELASLTTAAIKRVQCSSFATEPVLITKALREKKWIQEQN